MIDSCNTIFRFGNNRNRVEISLLFLIVFHLILVGIKRCQTVSDVFWFRFQNIWIQVVSSRIRQHARSHYKSLCIHTIDWNASRCSFWPCPSIEQSLTSMQNCIVAWFIRSARLLSVTAETCVGTHRVTDHSYSGRVVAFHAFAFLTSKSFYYHLFGWLHHRGNPRNYRATPNPSPNDDRPTSHIKTVKLSHVRHRHRKVPKCVAHCCKCCVKFKFTHVNIKYRRHHKSAVIIIVWCHCRVRECER